LVGVVGSGVGNALVGTTTGTVGRRTGARVGTRVGVGVGVGVDDGLGDSEVSVALGLEELRVGLGVWLADIRLAVGLGAGLDGSSVFPVSSHQDVEAIRAAVKTAANGHFHRRASSWSSSYPRSS
jgi:hypothetical protein